MMLHALGRMLNAIANAGKDIAGRGGQQYTTVDIAGDKFAKTFSDAAFNTSAEAFKISGQSYMAAMGHVIMGAAHSGAAGIDLGKAAGNTLLAATEVSVAAVKLGGAGAIELAEKAVQLSKEAVDAASKGLDGASDMLHEAAKALLAAGNAVNTARATDVTMQPKG